MRTAAVSVALLTGHGRETLPSADPSVLAGKVVLAFNPGESHRFTPIIRELSGSMPDSIAAVILPRNYATASRIGGEWSIPVLPGPESTPLAADLQKQFLQAYGRVVATVDQQPWEDPLKYLQFHFEYYCTQRWPKLAAAFRSWLKLWRMFSPKGVLVSSLQDSESQLPAEAAKRLGVPSMSIPHGAGLGRPCYSVPVEYVLYDLLTQRAVFERSGVTPDRLIACRDVTVEDEHPTVPIGGYTQDEKWHVLALTDPIGFAGCLSSTVSPSAQLEALRALDNPPMNIGERMSLSVKVHPQYHDLELFATVGTRLVQKILPPDSELKATLRQADLVVAVNYWGSALVHTLREGKAVVFFWTDSLIGEDLLSAHVDLFLEAGTLTRTPEEFWSAVRSFFTDPKLAEEMRSKALEFSRKNLDGSEYASVDEVIAGVLRRRRPPRAIRPQRIAGRTPGPADAPAGVDRQVGATRTPRARGR